MNRPFDWRDRASFANSASVPRRDATNYRIEGARVLAGHALVDTSIEIDGESGQIASVGGYAAARVIDARGLLLLPGIVDIHGDAFERQVMPRPGVAFPIDTALVDTDRQVVANGITTVFHGVTWSWEPGLRGSENARAILAEIERLQPQLDADTRFHLRHETFNLDAEEEVLGWIASRRIGMLAFNDHMTAVLAASDREKKFLRMVERSGVSAAAFMDLVTRTEARAGDVGSSVARLARAAVEAGLPMLSHDDTSPEQRQMFRALGCRLCEFPMTRDTARDAIAHKDDVVFGAPNVVRGGSHIGWTKAADMIECGLCTVLASDYYYPAPLLAVFRLERDGILPLERAWNLVAAQPAAAVGLADRGTIAAGQRADLILVAPTAEGARIVMTMVQGRIVHLTDAACLPGPPI